MNHFLSYLSNVRAELTHVVWPKPRQALMHTLIIVGLSAFAALFIALLDYVFTSIVSSVVI
ncbi:MAG: preprotein translocase subunit SecE [Minisyncoccia bacterium]